MDITKQVVVRSAIGLAALGKAAPHCIHDCRRAAVEIGSLFAFWTTAKRGGLLHSEHIGRVLSVEHSINLFPAVSVAGDCIVPRSTEGSARNSEAPERLRKALLCFQLWASTSTHRGLTAVLLFRTRAGRHDTRVAEIQGWVGFRIGLRVQLDANGPGHCKLSFPAPLQGYRARAAGGLGQALSTRLACPQRLIREQPPLSGLGNAAAWAN